MIKQTHIATAQLITTSGIVLTHTAMPIALPILVGSYFGSDLPDVDHPNHVINKQLKKMHLKAFSDLFKNHRGVLHTIYPVILFLIIAFILHPTAKTNFWQDTFCYFFFGLAVGYFIHLLCDSFSYQGVLWFYPFQQWDYNSNNRPYHANHKILYQVGSTNELYFGLVARILWYLISLRLFYLWFG